MKLEDARSTEARHFIPVVKRHPAIMVEGRGSRLRDADGKEYLDLMAGWAVCCLGHSHPALVEAISDQAGRLMQTTNVFYNLPQLELLGEAETSALPELRRDPDHARLLRPVQVEAARIVPGQESERVDARPVQDGRRVVGETELRPLVRARQVLVQGHVRFRDQREAAARGLPKPPKILENCCFWSLLSFWEAPGTLPAAAKPQLSLSLSLSSSGGTVTQELQDMPRRSKPRRTQAWPGVGRSRNGTRTNLSAREIRRRGGSFRGMGKTLAVS